MNGFAFYRLHAITFFPIFVYSNKYGSRLIMCMKRKNTCPHLLLKKH